MKSNYNTAGLTAASLLLALLGQCCNGHADTLPLTSQTPVQTLESATDSGISDGATKPSIEACWSDWKKQQNLKEGKNSNGILISHEKEAVNEDKTSHAWLSVRRAAFQTAELNARATLADTIRTEISSNRSAAQETFGGDDAAPSLEKAAKQLSIVDKTNVLVGKALDNEISQYDPTWDAKASPEAQQKEILKLQARVQGNIAANSQLFAAGAFTVVQCEGQSEEDGGKYAVLVGMIWSPKLAKIAEALWNPTLKLPLAEKKEPLSDQFEGFDRKDKNWLAYTMGARVFVDENGEMVVVGFGAVPQSAMMSVDKRRASLEALSAIQRFVGEKVEASQESSDALETRVYSTDEVKNFDTSAYQNKVAARSKDMALKGTAEITSWRGQHPWSNAKMQVVAMAWTPRWSADSDEAARMMNVIEQRMSEQGAVPTSSSEVKKRYRGAGAAAPAHSGASSNTHDF